MSKEEPTREGQILSGALFSEPMRVETVRSNGPGPGDHLTFASSASCVLL